MIQPIEPADTSVTAIDTYGVYPAFVTPPVATPIPVAPGSNAVSPVQPVVGSIVDEFA
jgi:hypothetical protein